MIRKLLHVLLLGLCTGSIALAQDPSVGGIVVTPNSLSTTQTGTIVANFGNGSSTAIPQSASATYTLNLPPYVGVTGVQVTVPSGTTANLTVVTNPYSTSSGTAIIITSDQGPVPGNANYTVTLNVLALKNSGGNTNVTINAAGSALGNNNGMNDNASTTFQVTGSALPVALISFTARAQEDRTVSLDWSTSMESNNKGFLVERSKDLKTFEKVGEVSDVAANSSATKNYHLLDLTPFWGTSYYRLTQTDLNGKTTVFPAVSVVVRDGVYGVFPNPVVNDQQMSLSLDEPETAVVNFYGADGRTWALQKTGVQSGNLLLKSVSKLTAGVYVLTVEERGQTRQHRLVVE